MTTPLYRPAVPAKVRAAVYYLGLLVGAATLVAVNVTPDVVAVWLANISAGIAFVANALAVSNISDSQSGKHQAPQED